MSDRVFISNLLLRGHHGVAPEENRLGQIFQIDIDCNVDIADWAVTDDYSQAVCYGRLCRIAQEVSDMGPCKLIETLAEKIAKAILSELAKVRKVTVTVRKPSAPIPAFFDHAGVSITRGRASL